MKNAKQLLMILLLCSTFLVGCGNNSTTDIVEETTKISTEAKPAIKSFERELKVKGETNDQEILDIFTKAMQALSERNIVATVEYTDIDMIMAIETGLIFDSSSLMAMVQNDFINGEALYEPYTRINDYIAVHKVVKANGMKARMQKVLWSSEALERFTENGQNPDKLFDIQGMYKIELVCKPAYQIDYPEKAENLNQEWSVYVININGEWKLEYATTLLFTTKNFTDIDFDNFIGAN